MTGIEIGEALHVLLRKIEMLESQASIVETHLHRNDQLLQEHSEVLATLKRSQSSAAATEPPEAILRRIWSQVSVSERQRFLNEHLFGEVAS